MSLYTIQSIQTQYYILSDGKESDKSILATVPKDQFEHSNNVCIPFEFMSSCMTLLPRQDCQNRTTVEEE